MFKSGSSQHLVLISVLRKLCNSPGLLLKKLKHGKVEDKFAPEAEALLEQISDAADMSLSGKMLAVASFLRLLKRDTEEKVVLGW